ENSSVPQEVIKILEKEGIKISNNFPRQIDRPFVELNDLILTMTKEQKRKLILLFPEYENKVFTLSEYANLGGDIYDPYGKDFLFYEMIFKQIKRSVDVVIDKLV
ncbi:MAG: hypothetical protein N2446_01445, partial [Elusimicrobiales bacterium]|nr:hypothetical protein [Elusimicrobiales bacterium]